MQVTKVSLYTAGALQCRNVYSRHASTSRWPWATAL